MDETEKAQRYWQDELEQLRELRDNSAQVQAGLDYAIEFLTMLRGRLSEVDQTLEELKAIPQDERSGILKVRQDIVRALCDKVYLYADHRVKIEGALDGSEESQFCVSESFERPFTWKAPS